MSKSCLNCEHRIVCALYNPELNDKLAIKCTEYLSKTKHYEIQPSINQWYKVVILYRGGAKEHKLFTVYSDAVMFYQLVKSIKLNHIANIDIEFVRIGDD